MPFTRGAREVPNQTPASSSDARKRIEEAVNAIRDGLRDAVENMDTSKIEAFLAAGYEANHTPPSAPREPWEAISTDRDQPTLATMVRADGDQQTAKFYRDERAIYDEWHEVVGFLDHIESVTLLHTHDPVTQVPVERALIDEAARWVEWADDEDEAGVPRSARLTTAIVRDLAALADGAES